MIYDSGYQMGKIGFLPAEADITLVAKHILSLIS